MIVRIWNMTTPRFISTAHILLASASHFFSSLSNDDFQSKSSSSLILVNKNTWQADLDLFLINFPLVDVRWLWPQSPILQLCGWNKETSSSDCKDTWWVIIRYVSITACSFAGTFLEVNIMNIMKRGAKSLIALWYCCWHINSVHSGGQLIFASRYALYHLPSSALRAAGAREKPNKKTSWNQT